MLGQRAAGLTADGKQKISLGRGLVREDVNVIMFDEPLTVIDPHLKWKLRSKLKELHQRVGATMIYVTHDQTEALTFADQVVVMQDGSVVQVGTPVELFERPRHTFVGHFIGSPGMNVLPCEVATAPPASPATPVADREPRPPAHGRDRDRRAPRVRRARATTASRPRSSASPTSAATASSRPMRRRRTASTRSWPRTRAVAPGPAHLAFDPEQTPDLRRRLARGRHAP